MFILLKKEKSYFRTFQRKDERLQGSIRGRGDWGDWSSLPCFEDKTTEVTWKINVAERTIIFSKLYKK